MSGRYFEYQLTGKSVDYINDIADDINDNDTTWRDKAERLQARRWKKILHSGQ